MNWREKCEACLTNYQRTVCDQCGRKLCLLCARASSDDKVACHNGCAGKPEDMVLSLLAQFFVATRLQVQRDLIFKHVQAIRIKQAEKAFAEMERLGGRPYVHFTER